MWSLRGKVLWWALYSRGFVITVSVLAHAGLQAHEPDDAMQWVPIDLPPQGSPHSASKLAPPTSETLLDQFCSFLCDGLIRWDAQYFLHLANSGYTMESSLAFFPLYPLVVQTLAKSVHWFVGELELLTYVSILKLSAVVLNIAAFIAAADVFYALSRRVLRDEFLAYKAALLFCLNPASIFFSAPYSESFFALFSFSAFLAIETSGLTTKSGLFLALATTTRANGIANAGFVIYHSMKTVATETILYVRARKKNSTEKTKSKNGNRAAVTAKEAESVPELLDDPSTALINISTKAIFPGMVNIILCLSPFAAFQWYAQTVFCQMSSSEVDLPSALIRVAEQKGHILPGAENKSSWCFEDPPMSYSYVQSHYWNNGFLNYWETKQGPNFALAAPAILLVFWQLRAFFRTHTRYALRLGLVDNRRLGLPRARQEAPATRTMALPRETLVYIAHAATLASFGLLFAHVQITTRLLLAASPVLPWICSLISTISDTELQPIPEGDDTYSKLSEHELHRKVWFRVERARNLDTRHSTLLFQDLGSVGDAWVKIYFFGYTLIGTILFATNYPWT